MIFNWLQRTGTTARLPQLSPLMIIFPWPQATRGTHKVYRKHDTHTYLTRHIF